MIAPRQRNIADTENSLPQQKYSGERGDYTRRHLLQGAMNCEQVEIAVH